MRRLPIYFLVDVSESMVGQPIEEVQNGMRTIIQDLRVDPYALETVFVSILAFAGKAKTLSAFPAEEDKTLSKLTELSKFYPPTFPIGGGTSLGAGMNYLMDCLEHDIQKTTMEAKGDWKPIIFLFTDGTPTDDYLAAFQRWNDKHRRRCNLVTISIGDNVNTSILGQLTENVLLLKKTDKESFQQFFRWITATIKATSQSVGEQNSDEIQLPATAGINLEKANPNEIKCIDENFAVVMGKCQTTNKPYLIKYARKSGNSENVENLFMDGFRLVGAYPIDEKQYQELSDGRNIGENINTNQLYGRPACPCCGNQLGFVICECGNIFCAGENANDHCPWCGMHGELSSVGEGGIDVSRTQG
ncbi:MAG: VWA domain-containing protein [Akkermansiaceae bacterium]|nr:VWA domain-containing protein [Akkermansiaceae bacterium]